MDFDLGNTRLETNVSYVPRVLAVDDDEDNLVLLAHVLKSLGCLFTTATTAEVALLIAQADQPDLILLDIVLPKINGFELLHFLKQDPRTCHIPTIAVTGLALAEERELIEKAGFDDYIIKPYLLEDLESRICGYLQGKLLGTLTTN